MHALAVLAVVAAALVSLVLVGLAFRRRQYTWTAANTLKSARDGMTENYVNRALVTTDVAANVFSFGQPCITISSRCGLWALRRRGHDGFKAVDHALELVQPDHGFQAMSGDLGRNMRGAADMHMALKSVGAAIPGDVGAALDVIAQWVQTQVAVAKNEPAPAATPA